MKIYPAFDLSSDHNYLSFVASMEQLLDQLLPEEIRALKDQPEQFFKCLAPILPLICSSQLKKEGNAFSVTVLSSAEYTHGTGRFLSDALSRRFIPGKIVELVGTRTMSFYFFPHEKREFLLSERWIMANHPSEIELIQQRLPRFIEELRLTFLCIVRTRHFLSMSSFQPQEGVKALMPEIQHLSTFEEMQRIVQRLTAETTIKEIRNYIAPFYKRRPKVFDRDIFEEIKFFIPLYHEKFISDRKIHGVARLICYHFYFQKHLGELRENNPMSRHLLIKIFRRKKTLGILILLNLFKDNEVLKKQHLIDAIRSSIPNAEEIEESFLTHVESHLFFYIEIHKHGVAFETDEVLNLRTKLPLELKKCIQRTVNPLFMLRNEEEQMRYLIALSRELRDRKDIPQIAISFEEQTEESLIFSVILARVLKKKTIPIKQLLSNLALQVLLRERKTVGKVHNKYPKEVSVFRVLLPKEEYLRRDHSLDLPKARQAVLLQLKSQFQDVRDYNGGLLSKQLESLQILKDLLGIVADSDAFVLENFFFSLEPLASQITLRPDRLKEGFTLLLNLIETNCAHKICNSMAGVAVSTAKQKQGFISFLEAARDNFSDISYSMIHLQDQFYCIFFFSENDQSEQQEITTLLHSFLEPSSSLDGVHS
jgi:hypothetical protein